MGSIEEIEECSASSTTIPLLSLNHVSFVCKSVSKSVRFYEDVLGFVLIKRPSSFDFEGAWYAHNTVISSVFVLLFPVFPSSRVVLFCFCFPQHLLGCFSMKPRSATRLSDGPDR